MLIPCNIHVITTPATIGTQWAVYTHSDPLTGVVKYIGGAKLSELFTLKEARSNSEWAKTFTATNALEIKVIGLAATESECFTEVHRLIQALKPECNMRGHRFRPRITQPVEQVECIETGERFASIAAAADAHNVAYSQLHNHVTGKRGHKTVHGRTYRKVIE